MRPILLWPLIILENLEMLTGQSQRGCLIILLLATLYTRSLINTYPCNRYIRGAVSCFLLDEEETRAFLNAILFGVTNIRAHPGDHNGGTCWARDVCHTSPWCVQIVTRSVAHTESAEWSCLWFGVVIMA